MIKVGSHCIAQHFCADFKLTEYFIPFMHHWYIARIVLDIFILDRNFIKYNLSKKLRIELKSNETILRKIELEAQNILRV